METQGPGSLPGGTGGRGPGEPPGGTIGRVRPDTIGADLGLKPGDRLYAVNGTVLRDYIDYRYLTAEPFLEMRVVRRDGREETFEVEKDPDEDIGLEFTEDVFGGPAAVKTCVNRCVFCFVDRLPGGLRPALYVKDDDYRLSFLHGNFITLTNLSAADRRRILALRLSPLYVSVHTTDPDLRAEMMGNPRAAEVMGELADLVAGGITIHTQVVVCPGLNDGEALDRTFSDLASLRPGLASVGVVPVGLTCYGPSAGPVRPLSAAEAVRLLDAVLAWHRRLGGFVYPADELFLVAGRKVPGHRFYEGFPQAENGIGLARLFLEDLSRLKRRLAARGGPPGGPEVAFTALTGTLALPLVREAVELLRRETVFKGTVIEAANELFGPSVTVAGLLSGADLLAAAGSARPEGAGRAPGPEEPDAAAPVLVPGAALRAGSDELLDGLNLGDLSRAIGRPVLDAGWLPSQMLARLESWKEGR